ncbi:MAG: hypothetical protein ACREPA_06965 [Candidatus Dormibacteraceae bacterium]
MLPGVQPQPEFLIDRALGIVLADAIRELGYVVHTLRSLYGEDGAAAIADEVWIPESAALGRILLTKDDAIRRYPPARSAAEQAAAKLFCLPNAHLTTDQMRERFLNNLNRIIQRSRHAGPYMYAVDPKALRLLWPK